MFDDVLIESAGKDKTKGGWVTALISAVIHFAFIGAVVAAGYYVKEEDEEEPEKPMVAFAVGAEPAPPPPPPPPPPASNSGATRPKTVEIQQETPQRQEFRQPTDVPQDVPEVADVPSTGDDDGGVPGGVVGGVKGGVVGGVVGGVIGGVVGGTLGGQLGGELGGTGDSPVRVGGNVKAPVVINRVEPEYTEIARKARVAGVVIIEAVIDKQGNVTEARVLKPLPMGLDQQALAAIKQWKFRPGTLNGQPVAVYYNLTINFRLE